MDNKDSYVIRLPYEKKCFFENNYILNDQDVEILKTIAKDEGRSLRTYITGQLKKITKMHR